MGLSDRKKGFIKADGIRDNLVLLETIIEDSKKTLSPIHSLMSRRHLIHLVTIASGDPGMGQSSIRVERFHSRPIQELFY